MPELLEEHKDPKYTRLNAERAHGTLGEWLCYCPLCGWQWRARARWHKPDGRFKLLTWQSGCCAECYQEYLLIVPGMKFFRMGHYEGP